MNPIWRLRIIFWISCLCLPASLFTALFLINVINPMGLMFLTSFRVSNQSGEAVSVPPVGVIGDRTERRALPLSACSFLCIPALRERSFFLALGRERTITYDWDDIQFSEIVVESASGSVHELVVDPNPRINQYSRVATNFFVIPPLAQLPVAGPEVRRVLHDPHYSWRLWAVILIGALAPVGLTHSRKKLKRLRGVML